MQFSPSRHTKARQQKTQNSETPPVAIHQSMGSGAIGEKKNLQKSVGASDGASGFDVGIASSQTSRVSERENSSAKLFSPDSSNFQGI